ncbi:putative T7SS-secreted protein [Amycolatopsis sp. YIM 10]|uniref:putative T7SS-secreted protein n=1 Tax=Amycolatopsis sp. YIM 10 TaxID=2653857 RepID=UPI0012901210|nr:hypothetical protein [Amycolatopsis sp. YIM 10]QFU91832.1 hypothetical protein YIM_33355 [Amycolatopsis sp. YIM 10]
MAVELGQTTNPRDLIPGEPEAITNDLRQLVGNIDLVGGVGDGLQGIDPREWTGEGANAFRDAFGAAVPRWFQAVDFLGQGGEKLADYGDTLTWAQGEAQRAIELFTEAQAVSRAALEQFNGLARQAVEAGQSIGLFQDPGEGLAQEARAILAAAREAVASTGGAVADAFGGDGASLLETAGNFTALAFGMESNGEGGYSTDLPGGGTFGGDNRQTERVFNPETGKYEEVDPGGWQQNGLGSSYANQYGSDASLLDLQGLAEAAGIDVSEVGWEGEVSAALREGSVGGEFDNGTVSGSGELSGSVLSASAGASGTASWLGASGSAHAEAYLAQAHAEGELNFGEHASVSGSGDVMVGAEASAEGNVSWTGAEGSVEAFAGAKAEGEVSAEAGGLGAGATGEVWAGVGAEASGQFGMGEDGNFHIGASVGAALGVGGSVGFDVEVDPGEVVDTVSDVSDDVADVAADAVDNMSDTAGDVWDSANDLWS